MRTAELSDREEKVLRLLIESHVRSARPVSSSAIAAARSVALSSATVRNVLRSLAEKELILQPHTSAGRVPTDRGYRYYVDFLMRPTKPSDRVRGLIEERISGLMKTDEDTIATELSRMVSRLTKELAVSVTPAAGGVLKRLDLVPFGDGRAIAVVTLRSGAERSVSLSVSDVEDADLEEAARLLNRWLGGARVAEAEKLLRGGMRRARPPVRRVMDALLDVRSGLLSPQHARSVHYEGARYMFRHPEFEGEAACLGEILDSEEMLADALGAHSAGPVAVCIGEENRLKEMRRMSLVAGSYRIGGGMGRMAVIGPTRMKYPKFVGLVRFLSDRLENVFTAAP
ncbi:MAG: heat-inducible transcription repressor HrcA [Candidatus Eisenbacteria bacterium]|nr:heat-inducible transcription repressor HrcA [Candidatus Eisenbacteria bacterium]